jgi:hypothetical protein
MGTRRNLVRLPRRILKKAASPSSSMSSRRSARAHRPASRSRAGSGWRAGASPPAPPPGPAPAGPRSRSASPSGEAVVGGLGRGRDRPCSSRGRPSRRKPERGEVPVHALRREPALLELGQVTLELEAGQLIEPLHAAARQIAAQLSRAAASRPSTGGIGPRHSKTSGRRRRRSSRSLRQGRLRRPPRQPRSPLYQGEPQSLGHHLAVLSGSKE